MANRTPPYANYPAWSTARFWSFIRSALRNASTRYPPKYDALEEARRLYKGPNKRQKWQYLCKRCGKWYSGKEISVDHITPAGSLRDFSDLPGFVERLFCAASGLQILCAKCHSEKSLEDKKNG